jgi:hypothetical protein
MTHPVGRHSAGGAVPKTAERVRTVCPSANHAASAGNLRCKAPANRLALADNEGLQCSSPPENDHVEDWASMRTMAQEIGRALRRARLARRMTLKDLADASADRFRPTSVAGYERGERKISLVRFCELCRVLDVPPERVLSRTRLVEPPEGIPPFA